ncbi:hypothetical protein Aca07nite_86890 [Actinoplanes capillaceus]|uniref:Extradiol ring-cleavage dioxygenase class III enzyme subunit B domain-containing protein n=1 Tax=Actinoplanes campanulatus TaxID=113559 RepID=A0ABQ3WYR8_9ACTN|nr:hypothetical protein Aca07nite_86890 [Actinoplanes capillaceus]
MVKQADMVLAMHWWPETFTRTEGAQHRLLRAHHPGATLSINADKPLDYHLELGAKLAPLRERGVLIVASGNVVHNLRAMDWSRTDDGYDWARSFDEDARARMLSDPADFAALDAHRDYLHAVPTPDHFIPALYLAGLAMAAGTAGTDVLVDGYAYGALSMTAYTLGLSCPRTAGEGGSPQPPADLPPDASNI